MGERAGGTTEGRTVPTQLTVRVSYIPHTITSDQFLKSFGNFVEENIPEERKGRKNIILSSYAPSAISADSRLECVATVTLQDVPSVLHCRQTEIVLVDEENSFPVVVDTHFIGITPLNNPAEKPTVDIFAVTGLAGHAFGSWKSRKAPTMWLRDFLPKTLPTTRILTYGYDSSLLGSESNASIREFAGGLLESLKTARALEEEQRRPIIFIGHSLGGLVIKQALVRAARGSPKDQLVFHSCYGILFFGVPNRGLDVQAMRSMVKGQPNSRLIEDLDPSSQTLRLLHDAFCDNFTFKESQITSIYETKLTRTVVESPEGVWQRTGPMVLMVPETSATYSGPTEKRYDQLSIDSNHSDMVKFSDRTNTDFLAVRQRIIGFVEEAPTVVLKRFTVAERDEKPTSTRPYMSRPNSTIPLQDTRVKLGSCAPLSQAPRQTSPTEITKGMLEGEKHPNLTAPANRIPPQIQRDASRVKLSTTKKDVGSKEYPELTGLTSRALMYQNQGRLKEALAEWVHVVATSRQLLGENSPRTLASMAHLAMAYCRMGRLEEGQDVWIQVLAISKKVHGENHRDTLTAMARLASTYVQMGRMKEARALWVSVVATMEGVLGRNHPDTLAAKARLEATCQDQGRS